MAWAVSPGMTPCTAPDRSAARGQPSPKPAPAIGVIGGQAIPPQFGKATQNLYFLNMVGYHTHQRHFCIYAMLCSVPNSYVEALIPSTPECNFIWRQGLQRAKLKMGPLGWALSQYDWCPFGKRKCGHRGKTL